MSREHRAEAFVKPPLSMLHLRLSVRLTQCDEKGLLDRELAETCTDSLLALARERDKRKVRRVLLSLLARVDARIESAFMGPTRFSRLRRRPR